MTPKWALVAALLAFAPCGASAQSTPDHTYSSQDIAAGTHDLLVAVPALSRAERRTGQRRRSAARAIQAQRVGRGSSPPSSPMASPPRACRRSSFSPRRSPRSSRSFAPGSIRPASRSKSATSRAARRSTRARATARPAIASTVTALAPRPTSATSAPDARRAALQRSLLEPTAAMWPINRPVRLVTSDGREIKGRRLNEDTYTVQVIDDQERLLSFDKADAQDLRARQDLADAVAAKKRLPPTKSPTWSRICCR